MVQDCGVWVECEVGAARLVYHICLNLILGPQDLIDEKYKIIQSSLNSYANIPSIPMV